MYSIHDVMKASGGRIRNFVVNSKDTANRQWKYNVSQVFDWGGSSDINEILAGLADKAREEGRRAYLIVEVMGDYNLVELQELADIKEREKVPEGTVAVPYIIDQELFDISIMEERLKGRL